MSDHGTGAQASNGVRLRSFLSEAVFVGAEDITVHSCCDRADRCRPGDVFVPRHAADRDEHEQVAEAVQRGAVAVIAERLLPVDVPQCLVPNNARVYAQLCQQLAGNPTRRMLTVGIVGTHGKTTTALFVAAMLKRLGGAVAYRTSLGTSDSRECDRLATKCPGPQRLAGWLAAAERAGAPAAVIELSDAMLRRHVAAGIDFDVVIVTSMRPGQRTGGRATRTSGNLVRQLVQECSTEPLVLYNADDACASLWAARNRFPAATYGLDAAEHVRGKRLGHAGGEQQLLVAAGRVLMPLTLKLPGDHIARSALAAVATAWLFDFSIPDAIAGVETLTKIPGRMQRLAPAVEFPIHIDAAVTPDQLAVVLHALRRHQMGRTTVVHDLQPRLHPQWRHRLGEVFQANECRVVLTGAELSPQHLQSMAMDVLGGVKAPGRVQIIPDREAAIRWAVANTSSGNVLLSGRGIASWVTRDGELCTDEEVALAAVQQMQPCPIPPTLNVFPSADSDSIFSH
ncbi:MAG: UDP-N-acetylmuramoyl-L-alanyl-D-glutamate--2,6-diaminopimelate ligase [Pirellulaceae bacterium]|nr:MAG: UDP-N-acetylmuramoyl-L-alanyl-D-glutamate--2,6-diaminopimelate ligase [Pirellulaceae bacterium]